MPTLLCIIGACLSSVTIGGCRKTAAQEDVSQGFRHSGGVVAPPASKPEQTKVLTAATLYTHLWLTGQYDRMYSLVSPRGDDYRHGNKTRFVQFLHRQRKFPAYQVLSTVKPENMRLVSVARPGVAEFFVVSLDTKSMHQFMTGQWPDWAKGDIAVVEFTLRNKDYRQVWEREPTGSWLCLNLPLDLDTATAKQLHFGTSRRKNT